MSIRSTILGITSAFVFTAALGAIATADDQMPADGPGGVEKSLGKDFGAGGPGQDRPGMAVDRDGKMMPGQEPRGALVDTRAAAAKAGRMDTELPNLSPGSPFSKGN